MNFHDPIIVSSDRFVTKTEPMMNETVIDKDRAIDYSFSLQSLDTDMFYKHFELSNTTAASSGSDNVVSDKVAEKLCQAEKVEFNEYPNDKIQSSEINIMEEKEPETAGVEGSIDYKTEREHEMEFPFHKLGQKGDIMSIVMKRRLGSSSNESSPVKKSKIDSIEEKEPHMMDSDSDVDVGNILQGQMSESKCMTENFIQSFISQSEQDDVVQNRQSNFPPTEKSNSVSRVTYQIPHISLSPSQSNKTSEQNERECNEFTIEKKLFKAELEDRSTQKSHTESTCEEPVHMHSDDTLSSHGENRSENESQNVEVDTDMPSNKDKACSEIRLKILPTVYKNERGKKDSGKFDEEINEEIDEPDGDPSSSIFAKTSKDGNAVNDCKTSHYFQSSFLPGSKKSRKQVMPKRIFKHCISQEQIDTVNYDGNNRMGDTYLSAESTNPSSSKSVFGKVFEKRPTDTKDSHTTYKSHEKSRKQSTPKRVIELEQAKENSNKMKTDEQYSQFYDSPEMILEKSEKQGLPQNSVDLSADQGTTVKHIPCENEMAQISDTVTSDDSQDSVLSDKNVEKSIQNSDSMNRFVSPYFKNESSDVKDQFFTPDLASLSQQIAKQAELLARLTQSRIQMEETQGENSELPLNENLAFIRKLREIRFYKYRKISISEKKHISGFAKIHGVSAAANYFGVSKSAVSLWTRTDFKETDEDLAKKKRNCMIGNEKFETLVQRVRQEKSTKFKNLSREDKMDVVRYAKLVGVREMSRCLDIALGTVSGWMRQFPYAIKKKTDETASADETANEDNCDIPSNMKSEGTVVHSEEEASTSKDSDKKSTGLANLGNDEDKIKHNPKIDDKMEMSEKQESEIKFENADLVDTANGCDSAKIHTCEAELNCLKSVKKDLSSQSGSDDQLKSTDTSNPVADSSNIDCENKDKNEKSEENKPFSNIESELESMIADSYVKLDVQKCFDDIKDQINGTVLDGDEYFEQLFKRVTETRVEKYKTLKASEKLEVVRYAKRIGVRRIAKIMDLATGTLSGWITKYQHLLGLMSNSVSESDLSVSDVSGVDLDQSLNSAADSEFSVSQMKDNSEETSKANAENLPQTLERPSSILDNVEKSEVTALKFLLQERFPLLLEKIDLARKMKFKNLIPAEKIEIVKCAKLVGIRPTARVFQMPLGTLSGWITKYSNYLEPEFQGDGKGLTSDCDWLGNSSDLSTSRLNESDLTINTPLKIAPHLQWAYKNRTDKDDNSALPSAYSQMMNQFAEKSFTNTNDLFSSSFELDSCNSKTNILNRRVSVEWPKLNSQDDKSSDSEMSWPKLKLPNGAEENLKLPNTDVGFPNFLLHGNRSELDNDESTKTLAEKYLKQFGMVHFANQT